MSLESSRAGYESPEQPALAIVDDPLAQLHAWIDDAYRSEIAEPNAMSVATVDEKGRPSNRIVLLRGLDERGLIFYTSYFSRKGRELAANPATAVTLYWPSLHRQVRVEGLASVLAEDESDAYFATRPRGHQLSAWASEQSERLDRREALEERLTHFAGRFEDQEVPRPHSWGGYLISPERIEFWQGLPNRMHDRIQYTKKTQTWTSQRLQP